MRVNLCESVYMSASVRARESVRVCVSECECGCERVCVSGSAQDSLPPGLVSVIAW